MTLSGTSPYWIVNAFTDGSLFTGNPAAVCPLEAWPEDEVMQAVAAQNNLAETSFLVPRGAGEWSLRWFTPVREVTLCGHATLAAARVLFDLGAAETMCGFETLSGRLTVERDAEEQLWMDFPTKRVSCLSPSPALKALFPGMLQLGQNDLDYRVIEVATADEVRAYQPDASRLRAQADVFGFVLTAKADTDAEEDFVSRFFAPGAGVSEDPVTGSAHCSLFPYWGERLGKSQLIARQLSARGGRIEGALEPQGRVRLGGLAMTYAEGALRLG